MAEVHEHSRPGDGLDGWGLLRHVHKEGWLLHVGGVRVPVVDVSGRRREYLPALATLEGGAVASHELLAIRSLLSDPVVSATIVDFLNAESPDPEELWRLSAEHPDITELDTFARARSDPWINTWRLGLRPARAVALEREIERVMDSEAGCNKHATQLHVIGTYTARIGHDLARKAASRLEEICTTSTAARSARQIRERITYEERLEVEGLGHARGSEDFGRVQ